MDLDSGLPLNDGVGVIPSSWAHSQSGQGHQGMVVPSAPRIGITSWAILDNHTLERTERQQMLLDRPAQMRKEQKV